MADDFTGDSLSSSQSPKLDDEPPTEEGDIYFSGLLSDPKPDDELLLSIGFRGVTCAGFWAGDTSLRFRFCPTY